MHSLHTIWGLLLSCQFDFDRYKQTQAGWLTTCRKERKFCLKWGLYPSSSLTVLCLLKSGAQAQTLGSYFEGQIYKLTVRWWIRWKKNCNFFRLPAVENSWNTTGTRERSCALNIALEGTERESFAERKGYKSDQGRKAEARSVCLSRHALSHRERVGNDR